MKKNIPNPILRGALIAGMLVLVVFALIGVTKIVPKAINSISSAFSSISSSLFSPKQTIILSLSNNSVKSGEEVNISFEHKNKSTAGIYEFKFDCSNRDLSMILIDGTNQTNMLCTATSTLNSNPFKIIPQLRDQNSFVDSYIYVSFYDTEKNIKEAIGRTVLTVQNGPMRSGDVTVATTSIATTTSVIKKPTTNQKLVNNNIIKKSDLRITAKDTGIVVNNIFIPKTTFTSYETASVRFDISNVGNIPTGVWQFTALLPTIPSQVFPSGNQPSLLPGETIEYTLSMRNLAVTGNNTVLINVDPSQTVSELSEVNNVAVMTLVNSGRSYSLGLIKPDIRSSDSDLMLRIISKGYVNKRGERFYQSNSISENDRPAIRFEIENIGDEETGDFIFEADLDNDSNNDYISSVQDSFYAGESREYTIDFDRTEETGTFDITIVIDSDDDVDETNEDNNKLSEEIRVY
jgi:hypothetical protein